MSTIAPRKIERNNSQNVYYSLNNKMDFFPVVKNELFDEDHPIAWKQNTGEIALSHMPINFIGQVSISNNRQFIKLQQALNKQIKLREELLSDCSTEIEANFKFSSESLLNFSPDKISLQLTDDLSIFYTILKGDLTIYFEHFITDDFDSDEVIFSVFRGNKNIINFAGSFSDSLKELYAIEIPKTFIFEFT